MKRHGGLGEALGRGCEWRMDRCVWYSMGLENLEDEICEGKLCFRSFGGIGKCKDKGVGTRRL